VGAVKKKILSARKEKMVGWKKVFRRMKTTSTPTLCLRHDHTLCFIVCVVKSFISH